MIWPTGDSAKLRAAAAAWSAAGTKFAVAEILGAAGPMAAIRAQHIPEGGAIDAAFSDAYGSTTAIVGQCQTIAAQLASYADKVDRVHAAILDLLSRICDPLTGIKEVWEFLTDEDEDEIKKIADDIRTVIDDFTGEVDALRAQIATLLAQATTVVTTMARYAGRQWDRFRTATPWVSRSTIGQFDKGVGLEAWELLDSGWTYSQVRLMIDPEGYFKSLRDLGAGLAPLVGAGGEHAPSISRRGSNSAKASPTGTSGARTRRGRSGRLRSTSRCWRFPVGRSPSSARWAPLPAMASEHCGNRRRSNRRSSTRGPAAVKTPPPEPGPVPPTGPPEPAPKAKPAPAPAGPRRHTARPNPSRRLPRSPPPESHPNRLRSLPR